MNKTPALEAFALLEILLGSCLLAIVLSISFQHWMIWKHHQIRSNRWILVHYINAQLQQGPCQEPYAYYLMRDMMPNQRYHLEKKNGCHVILENDSYSLPNE